MNRDGSITPLPEACNVPNPTSSEQKHCKTQRNIQGHDWCMDNWCIGHPDNSLWSEATHAEYNQCENRQPDDFFENVEEADPAIVEACEDSDAEDVDGCVIDTIICVESGKTIAECITPLEEDDRDANIVETLGQRDPSEQLEGWDGPVSHTNAVTLEREIVLEGMLDFCPLSIFVVCILLLKHFSSCCIQCLKHHLPAETVPFAEQEGGETRKLHLPFFVLHHRLLFSTMFPLFISLLTF